MKMIMKPLAYLTLTVLAVGCADAQTEPPANEWKATLKIVDETGQPVAGAETWVSYFVPPAPDGSVTSEKIAGFSDTNGIFTASHRDRSFYLGFHAQKTGHYPTMLQYQLGYPFQFDPVKWNPTATLLLKTIRHPIPMYAKWIKSGPPVVNKPVGYDLTIGDWVVPHGKGQASDIVFSKEHNEKSPDDYDSKLMITFPNSGDGIQEFSISESEKGGALKSPHESPLNNYEPKLVREFSRHPGQQSKFDYNEKRNYFFRVRTVLDENGNVKSAHYGKIYGDFMKFRYYFNPTPNDRNMEFDPKQNLLNGLKSTEQVDAP